MQLKPTIWATQDGEVRVSALTMARLLSLLKIGEGVLFDGKERRYVSKLDSTACL